MDYYELIIKKMAGSNVDLEIRADILSRCFDWFESGGCESDPYIERQYNYLLRVLKLL